jgi:signal transduction histidine kinase/ActR/RegA family two-component response regulator
VCEESAKLFSRPDTPLDLKYRVRHSDGRWVVLDSRGQAMVGDDGKTMGAVIVSRDVTDELEVEAEMYVAVEVAEQASKAKSDFLSRMSHELRTPLNSVLGFSQLLEMDDLPDNHGEAVGHIMRAGRHLLNLIDEVLDIARIESGNLELLLEPVAIRQVLGDAIDLAGPLAERREISVVADLEPCPETFHVLADRQRFLQVMLNLLSNAVKYNRVGGRVGVTVVASSPGFVRVTVTDTGNGISAENIDRVFEPFDRLGAESTGIEGTGVGLTLSKYLVERMGGTIGVHSRVGEGTSFTVDLPTAAAPKVPALGTVPLPAETPSVATLRVLHVEDNLANLELVEQVLTRSGVVELLAAMTGSLALELAREHRPHLILLDLHLPDMAGTELLDLLQADPRTADIPVVVVTADATPSQIQRLRDIGVAEYLTKPIDIKELLRVVEAMSDRTAEPR